MEILGKAFLPTCKNEKPTYREAKGFDYVALEESALQHASSLKLQAGRCFSPTEAQLPNVRALRPSNASKRPMPCPPNMGATPRPAKDIQLPSFLHGSTMEGRAWKLESGPQVCVAPSEISGQGNTSQTYERASENSSQTHLITEKHRRGRRPSCLVTRELGSNRTISFPSLLPRPVSDASEDLPAVSVCICIHAAHMLVGSHTRETCLLLCVCVRACVCVRVRVHVLTHTPASSSAAHRRNPLRVQHKVSISEAHFCAMDVEPGERKQTAVHDGWVSERTSQGGPLGAGVEACGRRAHNIPCLGVMSVSGLPALPVGSAPPFIPLRHPHPPQRSSLPQHPVPPASLSSDILCSHFRTKSDMSRVLVLDCGCGSPYEEGMVWRPELTKHHPLFLRFNKTLCLSEEC
nr:uncharacterized protein LOC105881462 [Microcebus murinus]